MKKIIIGAAATALVLASSAYAAQVGTGTITDNGSTSAINSDWTSGDPTGKIATGALNVTVNADVSPVLSMTLTGNVINLGNILPGTTVTGATNGTQISVLSNANAFAVNASFAPLTGVNNNLATMPLYVNGATGTQNIISKSTYQANAVSADVQYSATAAANQQSDTYTTTVTYTVTGTF